MRERRTLTLLEIQNLMMESLIFNEEFNFNNYRVMTFKEYGYQGTQADLFHLMEIIAVKKGMIDEEVKIVARAWGAGGMILHHRGTTNFKRNEIKKIYEVFHVLLNRGIISPGAVGNHGANLPCFHVTEYGMKCLEENEILPYDIDGYLNKLRNIEGLDEWVNFYMTEALKCFNANCYNAATAMIGLSSEVLIELLIIKFSKLLGKTSYNFEAKSSLQLNGKSLKDYFDDKIKEQTKISKRFEVFTSVFDKIKNLPNNISNIIDKSARDSFFTFLRLNRNEVTHCLEVKKDATETLLLFIAFSKYCTLLTNMINKIEELNN